MVYIQIMSDKNELAGVREWMGSRERKRREKELKPAAHLRISMNAAPAVSFGGGHRSLHAGERM